MARDQSRRPMTDVEIEKLREEMKGQREDVREALQEQGVDVSDWSQEDE